MQISALLRSDPLLIVAAHPDDETIGAGVLMGRVPNVQIVHVTDGAPRNTADARAAGFSNCESYAEQRKLEVRYALSHAGIPEGAIHCLQFPDQDTAFHLAELAQVLAEVFFMYRPRVVITHAYEGGHPDHDSVAFACRQAAEIFSSYDDNETGSEPAIWEFTGYHISDGRPRVYDFLSHGDARECGFRLSEEERQLKVVMLREFATQRKTLEPFMHPEFERFRRAPRYDFSRAPHDGKLFYEHFDWGVNGSTWRTLAERAPASLSRHQASIPHGPHRP